MLRCNLLPWGWYGEWEQDDDESEATLERWVMGVRSRRKWGAQGPRLTRRASLEWACRHLDPALVRVCRGDGGYVMGVLE